MSEENSTVQDRAMGALMGAFVGDALGVGPHWYYNLDELRHDYGEWIDDYTEPKRGRYHEGLSAGDPSQQGFLMRLTLESLVDNEGYDQDDFCRRFDEVLFPLLDGTPVNGPGGYTSQSIREVWRQRTQQGLGWEHTGGNADNTEALERNIAIAVQYFNDLPKLAEMVTANTNLTHIDETVVSMTTAFCIILGLLIQGESLDDQVAMKLMTMVRSGELPFHSITRDNEAAPQKGDDDPPRAGRFASPDALMQSTTAARAALDPGINIEPAWKASIVYGLPCAIYYQVPAAYYLAARFKGDFESAVLHAINGGGQNQSRAILTGALAGAQVGLSGIPKRFIEGLNCSEELIILSQQLTSKITN